VISTLFSGVFVMSSALNSENAVFNISFDQITAYRYNADFKGELVWEKSPSTANTPVNLICIDKTIIVESGGVIAALNSTNGEIIWKKKIQSERPLSMVPCSMGIFTIINDGSTSAEVPYCNAIIINPLSGDTLPVIFAVPGRCYSMSICFGCEIDNGLLIGVEAQVGMESAMSNTELFFIDYSKVRNSMNNAADIWYSYSAHPGVMSVNNEKNYFVNISRDMITLLPLNTASHIAKQITMNNCQSVICDSSGNLIVLREVFKEEEEEKLKELRIKNSYPPDYNITKEIIRLEKKASTVIEMYSSDLKLIDKKKVNIPKGNSNQLLRISDKEYCLCLNDRIMMMNGLKCEKTISLPGKYSISQTVILKDNSFLVASGRDLYHISTTGKITGKFTYTEPFTGRPVVSEDGTVYSVTANKVVRIR